MLWFLWQPMEVREGVFETQPVEDLCVKCGTAVSSFPLDDKDSIIERARTDRSFRAQLVLISEVWAGDRQKSFRPSLVRIRKTLGLKIRMELGVVDLEEFLIQLKQPASTSVDPSHTIDYLNEEWQEKTGVLVKLDTLPPGVVHRVAETYQTTETDYVELMLTEAEQCRDEQCEDQNSVERCRPCIQQSSRFEKFDVFKTLRIPVVLSSQTSIELSANLVWTRGALEVHSLVLHLVEIWVFAKLWLLNIAFDAGQLLSAFSQDMWQFTAAQKFESRPKRLRADQVEHVPTWGDYVKKVSNESFMLAFSQLSWLELLDSRSAG